jgi:hypothetical protein
VSREKGMKREREEEEREMKGSHILPTSRAMVVGVTRSASDGTGLLVMP